MTKIENVSRVKEQRFVASAERLLTKIRMMAAVIGLIIIILIIAVG